MLYLCVVAQRSDLKAALEWVALYGAVSEVICIFAGAWMQRISHESLRIIPKQLLNPKAIFMQAVRLILTSPDIGFRSTRPSLLAFAVTLKSL